MEGGRFWTFGQERTRALESLQDHTARLREIIGGDESYLCETVSGLIKRLSDRFQLFETAHKQLADTLRAEGVFDPELDLEAATIGEATIWLIQEAYAWLVTHGWNPQQNATLNASRFEDAAPTHQTAGPLIPVQMYAPLDFSASIRTARPGWPSSRL